MQMAHLAGRERRHRESAIGVPPAAAVARGLTAAGLLLSATVHLTLYTQGFGAIAVIGPLFLLNAAAGLALALAVLVWRHGIPVVAAIGFGLATLCAFYLSVFVGLFGVHETATGAAEILAQVAEIVVVLAGASVLMIERPPVLFRGEPGPHARARG